MMRSRWVSFGWVQVGLAIHWHPTPLDDPTSKLFWTRVTFNISIVKGEVAVELKHGFESCWDHHPFPGGLAKFTLLSKRELKMLQKVV